MTFDPKRVGSGTVERWSSLIAPAAGENGAGESPAAGGAYFYNFAPQSEFQNLIKGRTGNTAGPAEIAFIPLKGISRFG